MRVGFRARLAGFPLALALSLPLFARAQDAPSGDPVAGQQKFYLQLPIFVGHTAAFGISAHSEEDAAANQDHGQSENHRIDQAGD